MKKNNAAIWWILFPSLASLALYIYDKVTTDTFLITYTLCVCTLVIVTSFMEE